MRAMGKKYLRVGISIETAYKVTHISLDPFGKAIFKAPQIEKKQTSFYPCLYSQQFSFRLPFRSDSYSPRTDSKYAHYHIQLHRRLRVVCATSLIGFFQKIMKLYDRRINDHQINEGFQSTFHFSNRLCKRLAGVSHSFFKKRDKRWGKPVI